MNTAAIETRVREMPLAASSPPRRAWLFGSRARGEAGPSSDEVRARNAYWDLLPVRRGYRRTGRGAS